MATKITMGSVELTDAAADNLREVGMGIEEVAGDLQNVRNGDLSIPRLRERCLDGADDNRREGWLDYVSAIEYAAGRA